MNSSTTEDFRDALALVPTDIQVLARKNFRLWKANFAWWQRWRWREQRLYFLIKVFESNIVADEHTLNFGQALLQLGADQQFFTQPDKRAHHIDAHGHRALAAQNRGGHNGAVFGEDTGKFAPATAPL
jgi:hypothetical protein